MAMTLDTNNIIIYNYYDYHSQIYPKGDPK